MNDKLQITDDISMTARYVTGLLQPVLEEAIDSATSGSRYMVGVYQTDATLSPQHRHYSDDAVDMEKSKMKKLQEMKSEILGVLKKWSGD